MNKKALSLLLALAGVVCAAQAQNLRGDAAAGARKNTQCIGCHGIAEYKASFPQLYRVPMLAGQSETYLALALSAYRLGDRKHPTMRAVAGVLTDQDIADLAAYYAQQRPAGARGASASPAAAAASRPVELPVALKDKLATCTACHGADFVNSPDPANPRLAGQYPDYLLMALKAYRHDQQPLLGRKHAVMNAMVRTLEESELRQVADFLGGLPGPLATVPQPGLR